MQNSASLRGCSLCLAALPIGAHGVCGSREVSEMHSASAGNDAALWECHAQREPRALEQTRNPS